MVRLRDAPWPLTSRNNLTPYSPRLERIMKLACFRRIYTCARTEVLIVAAILAAMIGTAPILNLQAAAQSPSAVVKSPNPAEPTSTSTKPKFDVTSVKINKSQTYSGTLNLAKPGGEFRATNVTLRRFIAIYYFHDVGFVRTRWVLGGPSWLDSEHFDIEARTEGNPEPEQKNVMVQSLLEDRFKLLLHHETRQLPVYAMVVARRGRIGPQLTKHSAEAKCSDSPLKQPNPGQPMPAYCNGFFMNPRPGDLRETGNALSMDDFVLYLSQSMDRMVLNRTGLDGLFDFSLEFSPEVGFGARPLAETADASSPPSIFTALQQLLGLKLESAKGPVDVIVIDHVAQPTPN